LILSKNITEELDLNHLAGIATCSLHDFQRMFGHIAEMTISEYIRYRRLTLAGLELKHSDVKVIDVSLKYGYESPVSFARAFQAFHGCTPSMAKMPHVALKVFPHRIFQIIVREVSQMIRKDKIVVNGKEYEAAYFGELDMSSWTKDYSKREFWRLENVGDDFKNVQTGAEGLPHNNYPSSIKFEIGQVFVVKYHKNNGEVEDVYYIDDGTIWEEEGNIPCTRKFWFD